MKRGIRIEAHVVVYCDTCGDHYTDHGDQPLCFDSVTQAIAHLSVQAVGVGWLYDGDKVTCDACQATTHCRTHGHNFPNSWRTTVWALGDTTRSRTCIRCGVPEFEAQQ